MAYCALLACYYLSLKTSSFCDSDYKSWFQDFCTCHCNKYPSQHTYSEYCNDTSKTLIKNKFKFKVYVKSIARALIGVKDMVIFNWRYLAFIERKNLTKAQNPLLSKDKGGTNALGVSKSPSRKTFFLHLNIPCH